MSLKIRGIVKKNQGRGKKLGFPTSNIDVPQDVMDALYLGYTTVAHKAWPSLIYVGAAETFGDTVKRLETYILDFQGDLYDQRIEVELVKKLRDNKKFDSGKELVEQMKKDEEEARRFFAGAQNDK